MAESQLMREDNLKDMAKLIGRYCSFGNEELNDRAMDFVPRKYTYSTIKLDLA